jgi:predicted O-methyltransferase YrrM
MRKYYFNRVRKLLRTVIRKTGFDIIRVVEKKSTPHLDVICTYLAEYRQVTNFIPGMISPEAAELLYSIVVCQDIEGDILEIGAWQGKSTSYLARAVLDSSNGNMFAVDHFMGNVGKEHLYFIEVGGANLKTQFEDNMLTLGLNEVITLLPYSSELAYSKLQSRSLRFLFIDGDHSEMGVKKDIELFCPLVCSGGIVVFDDFNHTSPGVVLAAKQWMEKRNPRSSFVFGNMLVCKIW